MKNTYFFGYFPFITVVLFSLSFGFYCQAKLLDLFVSLGLYQGMLEFLSEAGIKTALLVVMFLVFFMLFSALKLLLDTIVEMSLLLFSKDSEGAGLKSIRMGTIIYAVGAIASLVSIQSIMGLVVIFLLTNVAAFIYFVYKISTSLSLLGLIGVIFFHIFVWSIFLLVAAYSVLKLYNSLINSLPI